MSRLLAWFQRHRLVLGIAALTYIPVILSSPGEVGAGVSVAPGRYQMSAVKNRQAQNTTLNAAGNEWSQLNSPVLSLPDVGTM